MSLKGCGADKKKRGMRQAERKKVERIMGSLLVSNERDSVTEDTGESGCQLPTWIAQTFTSIQNG